MTPGRERPAPRRSLPVQLLALLTIALLPLGLIAVFYTVKLVTDASEFMRRDLLDRTADAAAAQYHLIEQAQGATAAISAAGRALGRDNPECSRIMRQFVKDSTTFVFAGIVSVEGLVECSSASRVVDISQTPSWQDFVARPRDRIIIQRQGEVTGQSVIVSSAPIFDPDGTLLGAASVSIPHSFSDTLFAQENDDVSLALVDGAGTVLTASTGIDDAPAFEQFALRPAEIQMGREGITRAFQTASGAKRLVGIVPLIPGDLYIIGNWPEDGLSSMGTLQRYTAPAFPILMWITSLCVAFFAIDRLVLRHLAILRSRMTSYSPELSQGEAHDPIRLAGAPDEILQIAASYNEMLERITLKQGQLTASLRDKEVLIKEVHHRVRNNLQLIASILNMQIRDINTPETTQVLRRVQDRVMSLATIHKSLHEERKVNTVRADRLLSEIITGIWDAGLPVRPEVETTFALDPVELDTDQAIPLSLLGSEAITNAAKYIGQPDDKPAKLSVTLIGEPSGRIRFSVANSCGAAPLPPRDTLRTDLGSRLIDAFVSQLGGEMTVTSTAQRYCLEIRFLKSCQRPAV